MQKIKPALLRISSLLVAEIARERASSSISSPLVAEIARERARSSISSLLVAEIAKERASSPILISTFIFQCMAVHAIISVTALFEKEKKLDLKRENYMNCHT